MQLQEKIQSKGFSASDSFKTTAVLNPQEAAIFAASHLDKQNIADMKSNVEYMKEKLKKEAEARQAKATKQEPASAGPSSSALDGVVAKKIPAFEYIPGKCFSFLKIQ
jgi:hypothetical protein